MSANKITYIIHRDCIPVIKGKYWYKLTYEPILDSMSIRFDLSRGHTEISLKNFVYNYDTIETDCVTEQSDFKVYTVVSADTLSYTDNGITYIPVTSQESQTFAMCLVGTTCVKDGEIINITRENYLEYVDNIIGCSFIDFSISNQIKQILSSNITSECEQVDISYFCKVSEE
jgi:hypothetical protein